MILFLGNVENVISGFDLNPLGTLMASIDDYGVCLISDINTNDYIFHRKMSIVESNLSNYLMLLLEEFVSFCCIYKRVTLSLIL